MSALPPPAPPQFREGAPAAVGFAQPPCIVNAFLSALPSGVIGWVLGVLPSMFRNVGFKHYKTWLDDGARSGTSLFFISGAYSFSHCLLCRVRQVDDNLNRGVAGCMTGLAMGWSGGPVSAAQSCLGIGLISYVVDLGGSEQPAKASTMSTTATFSKADRAGSARGSSAATPTAELAPNRRAGGRRGGSGHVLKHMLDAAAVQRLPPVMWLGAVCSMGAGTGYLELPAATPWSNSSRR